MNIKLILCLLLMMTIVVSCEDMFSTDPKPEPPEVLPPITQEGKNTFGCLVNGKVWLPKRGFHIPGSGNSSVLDCAYYPRLEKIDKRLWGFLSITSHREANDESPSDLIILLDSLFSQGIYNLVINPEGPKVRGGSGNYFSNGVGYWTTVDSSNSLTITRLDTMNRIVSGTFEFDVVRESEPFDTIKIRDGRFDLNFIF